MTDDRLIKSYASLQSTRIHGAPTLDRFKRESVLLQCRFGKHLPSRKDARILDLGCGSGSLLFFLQEHGYTNCEGVDLSEEQVSLAKSLGLLNVKCADALEYLEHKDSEYDLIVARDLLEHIETEKVVDFLNRIRRALSLDGAFLLQVPNAASPLWGYYRHGDFTHVESFTTGSLSQLFSAAGYSKFDFFPTPPIVHGIRSAMRRALWEVIELAIKTYLLSEVGEARGIFTMNLIGKATR